jgi:hypothetical protein
MTLEKLRLKDHCEMCGARNTNNLNFRLEPALNPSGHPMTLCYLCRVGSAELIQERWFNVVREARDLRTVVKALLSWAKVMGGWDAPCWERAKRLLK